MKVKENSVDFLHFGLVANIDFILYSGFKTIRKENTHIRKYTVFRILNLQDISMCPGHDFTAYKRISTKINLRAYLQEESKRSVCLNFHLLA